MNSSEEPTLLALRNVMEYLMQHAHEPIMYSRNIFSKQTKPPINVYSKQAMQNSTKIRNTPTSSINIVTNIMQ